MHDEEWPGCMVSGHIQVNRVPGNFHVEAASNSHNFHGVRRPKEKNAVCAYTVSDVMIASFFVSLFLFFF